MSENPIIQSLRTGVVVLGSVLVLCGVLLLLYLGIVVFQFVGQPDNVGLIKYLVAHLKLGDKAFYGAIGGTTFEMNFSETVRFVLYMIIGIMILSVLAGILRTLVASGVSIIALGMDRPQPKEKEMEKENRPPGQRIPIRPPAKPSPPEE